jgi:hypothetical protein
MDAWIPALQALLIMSRADVSERRVALIPTITPMRDRAHMYPRREMSARWVARMVTDGLEHSNLIDGSMKDML